MAKTKQNFTTYVGSDEIITFTVYDENDAVKNITGATIEWGLFTSAVATVVTVSKTTGSGIVLTDPTNGVFTVTLLGSDTVALEHDNKWYHEARMTLSGLTKTIATGNVNLKESGFAP